MLSEKDSSVIAQKEYKVELNDGKIEIEGIHGFSIDVADPKLSLGKLYDALFSDITEPTRILLKPTAELEQDQKAHAFFGSLKEIVDGACEKMNPYLAEIRSRAEQFDAIEKG